MITHLRICCGNCQRMLRVPVEYLNKQVVCNHCQHPFLAKPDDKEAAYAPFRFAVTAAHPEEARALAGTAANGNGATATVDRGPEPRPLPLPPRQPSAERPEDRKLREELNRLRGELKAVGIERAKLAGERDRYRHAVTQLEADVASRTIEVETLGAKLATECDRYRATIGHLEAELATRTDDAAGLEAKHAREAESLREEAARGTVARGQLDALQSRITALLDEQQRLVADRDATRSDRDRLAREHSEAAAELDEARSRLGAVTGELEAARQRTEALERDLKQHQTDAQQLRDELEQQRSRRDQERQAQLAAFTALKQTLGERLQNRASAPAAEIDTTPAPPEPTVTAAPIEEPAHASAPAVEDAAPVAAAAAESDPAGLDDRFRVLRSQLRSIHEAEQKEKSGQPLVSRLTRILRPE